MAAKKRARKKAAKKAANKRRAAAGGPQVAFSVKFYGAEEFQSVKDSADRAGLSVSAWSRAILEAVTEGEPEDEKPAAMQKAIGITEADRERIVGGAALARVSGQPAWFRYILLAAASAGKGSVLMKQLERAMAAGEEISQIDDY